MSNLFEELKRRNVVRIGIAYLVIGWVLHAAEESGAGRYRTRGSWLPLCGDRVGLKRPEPSRAG